MQVVIFCAHWRPQGEDRCKIYRDKLLFNFLPRLYLPLCLLLLSPSRSPFPSPLPPPSFPALSFPSLQGIVSPDGRRQANSWGRGRLLGESKRPLATDFQRIGLRVSQPLWGSALHSWERVSLQPWGKNISGRTSRIAHQAVGRERKKSYPYVWARVPCPSLASRGGSCLPVPWEAGSALVSHAALGGERFVCC